MSRYCLSCCQACWLLRVTPCRATKAVLVSPTLRFLAALSRNFAPRLPILRYSLSTYTSFIPLTLEALVVHGIRFYSSKSRDQVENWVRVPAEASFCFVGAQGAKYEDEEAIWAQSVANSTLLSRKHDIGTIWFARVFSFFCTHGKSCATKNGKGPAKDVAKFALECRGVVR